MSTPVMTPGRPSSTMAQSYPGTRFRRDSHPSIHLPVNGNPPPPPPPPHTHIHTHTVSELPKTQRFTVLQCRHSAAVLLYMSKVKYPPYYGCFVPHTCGKCKYPHITGALSHTRVWYHRREWGTCWNARSTMYVRPSSTNIYIYIAITCRSR